MKKGQRAEIEAQVQEFISTWFDARQQVMETNFKRAHRHGLSATQFLLLTLLGEQGAPQGTSLAYQQTSASIQEHAADAGHAIGALAKSLNLDQATIVRTVDSLEQRGLVSRRREEHDRRRVYVDLTAAGHATLSASQEQFTDQLAAIFRAMRPPDRTALLSGLRTFVAVGRYLHEAERDDRSHAQTPAAAE